MHYQCSSVNLSVCCMVNLTALQYVWHMFVIFGLVCTSFTNESLLTGSPGTGSPRKLQTFGRRTNLAFCWICVSLCRDVEIVYKIESIDYARAEKTVHSFAGFGFGNDLEEETVHGCGIFCEWIRDEDQQNMSRSFHRDIQTQTTQPKIGIYIANFPTIPTRAINVPLLQFFSLITQTLETKSKDCWHTDIGNSPKTTSDNPTGMLWRLIAWDPGRHFCIGLCARL